MHIPSGISLVAIAALLDCSSAVAQSTAVPSVRTNSNCTTATLSTDPTAPCPDDVVRDYPGYVPRVVASPNKPIPAGSPGMIGSGISSGVSSGALGPAGSIGGATGMGAAGRFRGAPGR